MKQVLRQWLAVFKNGDRFVAYNISGPIGREMAIDHAMMVAKRRDLKSMRMLPKNEEFADEHVGVLLLPLR